MNKNFMKFESFQVGFLGNNKPEMGRAIITISNKTSRLLSYIDLQIKKNFDDDVLSGASPGCCSRGSPGGWREKSFLQNL